jgi:hypothetical protein
MCLSLFQSKTTANNTGLVIRIAVITNDLVGHCFVPLCTLTIAWGEKKSTVLYSESAKIDRSRPIVEVNKINPALATNASMFTGTVDFATRTLPEKTTGDCVEVVGAKSVSVFHV